MGQYYRQIIKRGTHTTIYGCQVQGEDYIGIKLMEHSWWKSPTMKGLTRELYQNKARVAWVGDYADDFRWEDPDGKPDPQTLWEQAWKTEVVERMIPLAEMTLDDKYLVNHTRKLYLDGAKYYKMNEKDGWCIHPLSLLTACGNGLGGGDYDENYPDAYQVGSWCMDEIEVLDRAPEGYTEEEYHFEEEL